MPNGDFEPMYSTNNIWYDTYTAQCLTNHLEDMEADIDTLQTGKANVNHTHNEYSPINHEHSEYALVNHSHTGYALIGHTHSYNDLEDRPVIPTTLPANGGNSDTVDGKHAADFATVESVDMLQTLVGSTSVQSQISTAVGTITPISIGAAEEDHVHNYNDLTNKPTSLPANGGNADTLDGKHASDFAAASHTHTKSQISGLVESSDYVVASGPSGEWTYRKWNSGISECWRQITGTITHYSTWNGFNAFAGSADWPTGLFITNPTAIYNCYIGSGYAIAARGGLSTTTQFRWEALGTDGDSNIGYGIYVYAFGKWK